MQANLALSSSKCLAKLAIPTLSSRFKKPFFPPRKEINERTIWEPHKKERTWENYRTEKSTKKDVADNYDFIFS